MFEMLCPSRRFAPDLLSRRLSRLALWTLTGLVFASGPALAVSSDLYALTLDPAGQVGYLDLDVDLGFPIGAKTLMVTVDCRGPLVRAFIQSSGRMPIEVKTWKADAALLPALSKAGLVSQKAGAVTVKDTLQGTQLGLSCAGGILSADFSKVNRIGLSGTFERYKRDQEQSIDTKYALRLLPGTSLRALSLKASVIPTPKGYVFDTLLVDPEFSISVRTEQVFMSDGKALYPLFYNGKPQDNAAATKLTLQTQIDFYVTDDPAKGGWRRTTYDYRAQTLKTVPVSKPTLPIRQ